MAREFLPTLLPASSLADWGWLNRVEQLLECGGDGWLVVEEVVTEETVSDQEFAVASVQRNGDEEDAGGGSGATELERADASICISLALGGCCGVALRVAGLGEVGGSRSDRAGELAEVIGWGLL